MAARTITRHPVTCRSFGAAAKATMRRAQKPKDQTPRRHALEELEQIRHELEQLEYQHQQAPFVADTLEWLNHVDDLDQDYDQSGPFQSPLSPGL
jgi:hypothetical protein